MIENRRKYYISVNEYFPDYKVTYSESIIKFTYMYKLHEA